MEYEELERWFEAMNEGDTELLERVKIASDQPLTKEKEEVKSDGYEALRLLHKRSTMNQWKAGWTKRIK